MDSLESLVLHFKRQKQTVDSEAAWLSCDYPYNTLFKHLIGRVTDRKVRSVMAACFRRLWDAPEMQYAHRAACRP